MLQDTNVRNHSNIYFIGQTPYYASFFIHLHNLGNILPTCSAVSLPVTYIKASFRCRTKSGYKKQTNILQVLFSITRYDRSCFHIQQYKRMAVSTGYPAKSLVFQQRSKRRSFQFVRLYQIPLWADFTHFRCGKKRHQVISLRRFVQLAKLGMRMGNTRFILRLRKDFSVFVNFHDNRRMAAPAEQTISVRQDAGTLHLAPLRSLDIPYLAMLAVNDHCTTRIGKQNVSIRSFVYRVTLPSPLQRMFPLNLSCRLVEYDDFVPPRSAKQKMFSPGLTPPEQSKTSKYKIKRQSDSFHLFLSITIQNGGGFSHLHHACHARRHPFIKHSYATKIQQMREKRK